jgi:hypothetical protein
MTIFVFQAKNTLGIFSYYAVVSNFENKFFKTQKFFHQNTISCPCPFNPGDDGYGIIRAQQCESTTLPATPCDSRPQSRQSAKRFSSRWNWDSPTPLAAGECSPPPFGLGGGHTRLRLKGWGSPNSNEGTYTVVLYIYKYFVF